MAVALALVTCIGAATVGGVFFGFSTFVMTALAQLPPAHGIAAMQRINVVVLNPLFLGTFVGTALLSGVTAVHSIVWWDAERSPLLLVGAGLYLVGCFVVTMTLNVPRNNRLAALAADSRPAHDYWPVYVREWSRWNHVRTAAAIASAACSAAALAR